MGRSIDHFAYLVVRLVLVSGLVSAALAFQAGKDGRDLARDLETPAIASFVVLLPYAGMLASTLFIRHPRMNRRGIAIILSGISVLSVAGVVVFGMLVATGPTDPDTAAHMAVFAYPILMIGCLVIITIFAMIVGAKE